MNDSLLLDPTSTHIVKLFLQGCERPRQIHWHRWTLLKNGQTASIEFRELGEIVDCFGPKILDLLTLGEDSGERAAFELLLERDGER